MKQAVHELSVSTRGPGAHDISAAVLAWVREQGITEGLLTLHVRHTSASLIVQENADPQVLTDLQNFLDRLVPHGDRLYRHTAEGPDDMPAHVRAALTSTTLSLPVLDGRPALGTWQAIYLWEHRDHPHRRRIALHLLGN
jgi:secondary thiamine-phosphate synthase enzyme